MQNKVNKPKFTLFYNILPILRKIHVKLQVYSKENELHVIFALLEAATTGRPLRF